MTLVVESRPKLDALSPVEWGDLSSGRSAFQTHAWYRASAVHGRLHLLVCRDGRQAVGALPLWLVTQAPTHYYHDPRAILTGWREQALLGSAVRRLAVEATALDWLPALISVSAYGYRGGAMIPRGRLDVAEALAAAALAVAREERARTACHYFLNDDDDRHWVESLARIGARVVDIGADCNLDIAWDSMDSYYRSLGSRGRRLRAFARKMADRGDRQWSTASPAAAATTEELFLDLARAKGDPDPPRELYRRAVSGDAGRSLLLSAADVQGMTKAALLVFKRDQTLFPKFFGPAGARDDYLYLTYTRLVELAIAERVRRIEYGGGSHQAKLLRGCRLRLLQGAFHFLDRRLELAMDKYLPHYERCKRSYFADLVSRYGREPTSGLTSGTLEGVR